MKTTLELPDELARRIKMRAVERNQKLKDSIEELLELGLANALNDKLAAPAPKPVRLKRSKLLTIQNIEAAIAAGRG